MNTTLPETSSKRLDRVVSVVLIIVLCMLLAIGAGVAVGLVQGIHRDSASRTQEDTLTQVNKALVQMKMNSDINSCRAALSARYIIGPILAGLIALPQGVDSPAFKNALRQANRKEYDRLNKLSVSHPRQFLQICHEN